MKLSDPLLHEVLTQWMAWQTLVENLTTGVAAQDVDPLDMHRALEELDEDRARRLAHLMVAYFHADTLDEGAELVSELAGLAAVGRRPRYGAEAGLTFDRLTGS